VSSWNFVAESYPIPDGLFDELRAAGCEIGLHGITHDDTLFRHRASFERQLPKIHGYLEAWRAVGFRSPATHRNPDWMPDLGCLYDSSFPDTDPYQPQPGGCCSIFPFFLNDLVELPITLPQDHTMFEILRQDPTDVWLEKGRWIMANHGLVNVLVHPDYLLTEERLRIYDQLLGFLCAASDGWHARPCDVASWWKRRASDGGDAPDAALAYAAERNGRIAFELGGPSPGRE
jgi:peptidoglycan/xylan/chitin deacetylase (PgdA/CDA1 family)